MPEPSIGLGEYLESRRSCLHEWVIYASKRELPQAVMPAKVAYPLTEIASLLALIKAHTTKVGIIYLPDNLGKDIKVSFDTALKLFDTLGLFALVVVQLVSLGTCAFFQNSVHDCAGRLIEACARLADELHRLVEYSKTAPNDDVADITGERLVLVGLVWAACDEMKTLIDRGELGELSIKIKQSIRLIDDGFEEFEEWAKDPQEMDDDDFGFDMDDDDTNSEDGHSDASDASDVEDDNAADDQVNPPSDNAHTSMVDELSMYSQRCVRKIGLVKLLLASLKLSLPKETPGSTVDKLYESQASVAHLIDKLIVELMMNFEINKQVTTAQTNIDLQAHKIAKIAAEAHKTNDQKRNWYTTWLTKFDE